MALVVSWDTITISMSKTGARSSILASAVAGAHGVESSCAPFFIFTGAGKDQVRHGGDQDDGGAAGAADRIGPGDGDFK